MQIREARLDEHEEAGRITAGAYAEFFADGAHEDREYLDRIADVASRAARTTILVAVDEAGEIVGSLTLELLERTSEDAPPPASPR